MVSEAYPRPPIVESVIEFQFADPVDSAVVTSAVRSALRTYARQEVVNEAVLLVRPGAADGEDEVRTESRSQAFKLSSSDMTEIVVLSRRAFVVSQLPDYPGWPAFLSRFVRDWTLWKKAAGYNKIKRVGLRYVNRLDIPMGPDAIIEEADYLSVSCRAPGSLGAFEEYSMRAIFRSKIVDARFQIHSATVKSPLENHLSVILDIDLWQSQNLPQTDERLFDVLGKFRVEKNRIFEECITPRTRELFSR